MRFLFDAFFTWRPTVLGLAMISPLVYFGLPSPAPAPVPETQVVTIWSCKKILPGMTIDEVEAILPRELGERTEIVEVPDSAFAIIWALSDECRFIVNFTETGTVSQVFFRVDYVPC